MRILDGFVRFAILVLVMLRTVLHLVLVVKMYVQNATIREWEYHIIAVITTVTVIAIKCTSP